jgi:hypothetical protein
MSPSWSMSRGKRRVTAGGSSGSSLGAGRFRVGRSPECESRGAVRVLLSGYGRGAGKWRWCGSRLLERDECWERTERCEWDDGGDAVRPVWAVGGGIGGSNDDAKLGSENAVADIAMVIDAQHDDEESTLQTGNNAESKPTTPYTQALGIRVQTLI